MSTCTPDDVEPLGVTLAWFSVDEHATPTSRTRAPNDVFAFIILPSKN
ncbi:MAG: hypothetical protein ABWY83_01045 [Actinomycetota bacterium]